MIWEQYKCAQEGVNKISLQKILTSNFFLCGRFEYGFQYNTFEYFCGWDGITFLTNIFCIRNIFFSDYFYQLKYVSMSHGSPIFWTFPPWKHQKIGGSEIVIVAKWLKHHLKFCSKKWGEGQFYKRNPFTRKSMKTSDFRSKKIEIAFKFTWKILYKLIEPRKKITREFPFKFNLVSFYREILLLFFDF